MLAKLAVGTAETIVQTLLEVMELRHLTIEKLFGVATDGASFMTGWRSNTDKEEKSICSLAA